MIVFYVDGGMLGGKNPSPIGVYWSVWCAPPGEIVLCEESREHHTNNEAEWLAVMAALRYAHQHHPKETVIHIYSDSNLIVQLFRGRWQAKNLRMRRLRLESLQLAAVFPTCVVEWRPRWEMVKRLGH